MPRLVTPLPEQRVHIWRPQEWGDSPGSDYWWLGGDADCFTVGAPANLAGHGWFTVGTPNVNAGTLGDLLSKSDIDTERLLFDAAGDRAVSPAVFGGFAQVHQFERLMGRTPTQMQMDVVAAWILNGQNSAATYFGMFGGGRIYSDSVNFQCSVNGTLIAGPAVDNAFHKWTVKWGPVNTEFLVDDVSQGTTPTPTDIWPNYFDIWIEALGTNRIGLALVHIKLD